MPGYSDAVDDYTEASLEQEYAELEHDQRRYLADYLTNLLPAVQNWIKLDNEPADPNDPADIGNYYPEDILTFYGLHSFVSLVNNQFVKFTYHYEESPWSRDEPPSVDEYVDFEILVPA